LILAGDIGGTKARFALYSKKHELFSRQQTETYSSSDFSSLEEIARNFLNKHNESVNTACFGVPGPVVNGCAQTTNLPWQLREDQIARSLDLNAVKLVNDLTAVAAAIPHFSSEDLFTLHEGVKTQSKNNIFAVLAPGTGLGQGFLRDMSGVQHVLASEGGHNDFSPTTELEIELLRYLRSKFKRVSYERVLSGPGLVNIYTFLKETSYGPEPPELNKLLQEGDPAAIISGAGQSGEYEICVKALDIFASVLGAQAGNLVLTLIATGGIYLGGGIPPKICKKLADGTAVKAYLNKGRLSYLVKKTPLHVIRDDYAALLGAASIAAKLKE
jgi:glucokinase